MNKIAMQLMNIENDIMNTLDVTTGDDIRENLSNAKQYTDMLYSRLVEIKKPSLKSAQQIFDELEDQNYHLLNQVLSLSGFFGKDKQLKSLRWLQQIDKDQKYYSFNLNFIKFI